MMVNPSLLKGAVRIISLFHLNTPDLFSANKKNLLCLADWRTFLADCHENCFTNVFVFERRNAIISKLLTNKKTQFDGGKSLHLWHLGSSGDGKKITPKITLPPIHHGSVKNGCISKNSIVTSSIYYQPFNLLKNP